MSPVARCDPRDTLADHLGNYGDDEFIHLSAVEKSRDGFGASHQPYVLASFGAQAIGEGGDWFIDDQQVWARGLGQRSREYVVLLAGIGIGHPVTDGKVVGLPSNNGGANRAIESAHAVVPFGARTLEPVDRTVLARDETIGTGRDVNDEFPLARHGQTGGNNPTLHLMKNEARHAARRPP